MSILPEDARPSTLVFYDRRVPEAWERAGRDRRAWGREHSEIHAITNDVIAIEFKPGALEASA